MVIRLLIVGKKSGSWMVDPRSRCPNVGKSSGSNVYVQVPECAAPAGRLCFSGTRFHWRDIFIIFGRRRFHWRDSKEARSGATLNGLIFSCLLNLLKPHKKVLHSVSVTL